MEVPYDIEALAAGMPDPRVRWPLPPGTAQAINRGLLANLLTVMEAAPDAETRDVLAIAAPAIQITLLTAAVVAATEVAARRQSITFIHGGEASLMAAFAAGEAGPVGRIYDLLRQRFAAALRPSANVSLRALAHRIVTNRGPGLMGRDTLVVGHNALLQRMARADRGGRFTYFAPTTRIAQALQSAPRVVRSEWSDMASRLVSGAAYELGAFEAVFPHDAREALVRATADWLATVAGHRAAVDTALPRLPQHLWSGTGGNYAARQLRAAVKRRGGEVTGFEHGGGGHIHRDLGSEIVNEFWLADRFVADTPAKAEVYRASLDASAFRGDIDIRIEGAATATFDWDAASTHGDIRSVLYVTTAFVGETCYPIQPLMPDPVYADWQGRLAEGLAGQGFEMLVKQHPGGRLRGRMLPMSRRAAYIGGDFGEAVRRAAAIVVDYPATTALWESMLSLKPVVFLDFGLADWNPGVRELFERRCRVVMGSFDEHNRPIIDFAAVAKALAQPVGDDAFAENFLTGRRRT